MSPQKSWARRVGVRCGSTTNNSSRRSMATRVVHVDFVRTVGESILLTLQRIFFFIFQFPRRRYIQFKWFRKGCPKAPRQSPLRLSQPPSRLTAGHGIVGFSWKCLILPRILQDLLARCVHLKGILCKSISRVQIQASSHEIQDIL